MLLLLLVLSLILAGVVVVNIWAELNKRKPYIYPTKPLATFIIIVIAFLSFYLEEFTHTNYTVMILIGLIFCIIGDVCLMFIENRKFFLFGLISFLIGHLVYLITFISFCGFHPNDLYSGLVLLILAVGVYIYLYNGLDKMKLPVLGYVIIISLMVNQAIATLWCDFFSTSQAIVIALGAFLFYISDIMLAVAKFKVEFKFNRISLAFYFAGQYLIALSTWGEIL